VSIGPLRRSIGALGLVALVPVAGMIVAGTLTPVDAARRAMVTLVALLLLGRLAGQGMNHLAAVLERTMDAAADETEPARADRPAPEVAEADV
jgi:hypothetical protein